MHWAGMFEAGWYSGMKVRFVVLNRRWVDGQGVVLVVLLVTFSALFSQTLSINVFPLGWESKFIPIQINMYE
jgi:hypothetical protein